MCGKVGKQAVGLPNRLKPKGCVWGVKKAVKALQTFRMETPWVGCLTCAERRSEGVFSRKGRILPG